MISVLPSSLQTRKHTLLAAFKEIILKTQISSETRRCVYLLALLSKSNIQNKKKVALEYCLHNTQHEAEKGKFTATSQPKDGSHDVLVFKKQSVFIRVRDHLPQTNKKYLFLNAGFKEFFKVFNDPNRDIFANFILRIPSSISPPL